MATKTLAEILAGVHNRRDLKRFFHDSCGLSIAEAAAKVAEIERDGTPEDGKELKLADMARMFRADRAKSAARMKWLGSMVFDAAVKEARQTPGGLRPYGMGPGYFVDDDVLATIKNRMAAAIADEIDTCKSRDELEAKLVHLEWAEDDIATYLDYFGGSECQT